MYLSASQIKIMFPIYLGDDQTQCSRQWYNKYVKKLPTPEFKATNLGSRLHSCIEHWLSFDETDDQSAFYEGWEKGLQPTEIETIKTLVTKGIDENFIKKYPERHIELPLNDASNLKERVAKLKKLKPTWEEDFLLKTASATWEIIPGILLTGFIDLYHSNNHIIDWKTSSNPHRYGLNYDKKSPKYIAKDVQLNIYAMYLRYVKGVRGNVNVSHTYFHTREPFGISEKQIDLTPDHIDKFYKWITSEVIPQFQKVGKMTDGEVKTLEVGKKACENYQGCAFQKICSGSITEAEYIKAQTIRRGLSTMNLMDKIAAKEAAKKAGAESVKKVAEDVTPQVGGDLETKVVEVEAPKPKKAPVKRTAKKTSGYTLIIGASVRSSEPNYTTLTQFFKEITEGMLKELGKDDWYQLDPFKRREMFHNVKDEIIQQAQGKTILVRFMEPDFTSLVNILLDDATTVIEGGMR